MPLHLVIEKARCSQRFDSHQHQNATSEIYDRTPNTASCCGTAITIIKRQPLDVIRSMLSRVEEILA